MAFNLKKTVRKALKVVSVDAVDTIADAAGLADTNAMLGKAQTKADNLNESATEKRAEATKLLTKADVEQSKANDINEAIAEVRAAKGK